ncbi:MAG: IS66 family insertion sequence element accessory protein TnpB [Bacteroidota bacterium]
MLSLSSAYRYYLYQGFADMRSGFDSLSGLVRHQLNRDPLNGDIFIFLNRRRNQVKLLLWDGDGFAIYYKRLEKGTYELPQTNESTKAVEMRSDELMLMLHGISLQSIQRRKRFDWNKKIMHGRALA